MGDLRIVAGTLRGRRIRVPAGLLVRPTSDRVRESLFAILGATVEGAHVLDAYAGSGALGFEALSRGAASATFLESDRAVLRILRENAASLGVEGRCRVVPGKALLSIAAGPPGGPFDLVLADPPYELAERGELLHALAGSASVRQGARIVVERDARIPSPEPIPAGFRLARTARYGRACLDFYATE